MATRSPGLRLEAPPVLILPALATGRRVQRPDAEGQMKTVIGQLIIELQWRRRPPDVVARPLKHCSLGHILVECHLELHLECITGCTISVAI